MDFFVALLLLVVGTWFSATGMFVLKLTADRFGDSITDGIVSVLLHWRFWIACALYGASFLCYLVVLRELPISIAYPLTSMNYIWAALLARRYLGERVDAWRWTGIGLIIMGITLITLGHA